METFFYEKSIHTQLCRGFKLILFVFDMLILLKIYASVKIGMLCQSVQIKNIICYYLHYNLLYLRTFLLVIKTINNLFLIFLTLAVLYPTTIKSTTSKNISNFVAPKNWPVDQGTGDNVDNKDEDPQNNKSLYEAIGLGCAAAIVVIAFAVGFVILRKRRRRNIERRISNKVLDFYFSVVNT